MHDRDQEPNPQEGYDYAGGPRPGQDASVDTSTQNVPDQDRQKQDTGDRQKPDQKDRG